MSTLDNLPEFFTVEETAKLLRVHPRTIRNRINAGLLPAKQVKGGKSRLIAKADALSLLEDVTPSAAPPSTPYRAPVVQPKDAAGIDADATHGSGEHLQEVQRALLNNPVGFRQWVPKATEQEDDKE